MIIEKYHYLDNASTTQKPQRVLRAMTNFYEQSYSNTHRGLYELSVKATDTYENARETVAEFIGAMSSEVVFTKNATESFNLLARSLKYKKVLVTELEHHSNFVPWQQLGEIKVLPYNLETENLDDFKDYVKDVDVVSFTHMSNVTGRIIDVKKVIENIRSVNKNCLIVVDGSQAVSHMKVDVKELDVDFYCFSSHKMYGPTGIGVLYGKEKILNEMPPFIFGGGMVRSVSKEKTEFMNSPSRFEAGTLDAAGAVGLKESVLYLKENFDEKLNREKELLRYLLEKFNENNIEYLGHKDEMYGPVVSFVPKVDVHDLAVFCDLNKVCIRVGHHCAEPLMKKLGVHATARASLSFYNTKKDIDMLIKSIVDAGDRNVRN
ncbi:MAG: aminotransferase class V-fold PLP-dependent enzyme [Candidatus Woesearchaeota archaeon]